MKIILVTLLCAAMAACASKPIQRKDGSTYERSVSLTGIAKSDVDSVVEISQQETLAGLKRITEKLYRRNPAEWQKGNAESMEAAIASIFGPLNHWHLSARRNLDWQASINNAFNKDFNGDRVEALMSGLLTMTLAAYNNKTQVYVLDSLDPQKLYNSARNIEIAVWRLSNAKHADNEPLLLSNGYDTNGVANLSFEREFGKIIATQDLIALVVQDQTNRTIRFGIINAASLAFLPI